MTGGTNKVQASMDTQVALLSTLGLLLLAHVDLMLVVDEVDNGSPRIAVVDVVAEPRRVDDRKLDLEGFLLQLSLDDLDFGELVELLDVTTAVVFLWGELGGKERVDECRFSKTRFTCSMRFSVSVCRAGR